METKDITKRVNIPSHWIIAGQEEIYTIVARHYGIDPESLKLKVRSRIVVEPRQLAMCVMFFQHRYSYAQIGAIMGGFDHCTVMHAIKTVQNIYQTDPRFKTICDAVNQQTIAHPTFPFSKN